MIPWVGGAGLCADGKPHDPHIMYSDAVDIRDVNDQVLYTLEPQRLGTCRGVPSG